MAASDTRRRLLDAAFELLDAGGFAAASVQAIANRAGVSAGALYRHFPSKAHLFVEILSEASRRDLAAVDAAAAGGSVTQRLEAAVAAHARRALRHPRVAWALLHEPVDVLVEEARLAHRRRYCENMAGLIRQGVASGELPEQDVDFTAAALVGAIAEALVGPLSPVGEHPGSEEEVVATVVRFCRRGLGLPDSETPARPRVVRKRATRSRSAR